MLKVACLTDTGILKEWRLMEDHATMLSIKHYDQGGTMSKHLILCGAKCFITSLLVKFEHANMQCRHLHTNTQTRLLFLQPALLESRRHRPHHHHWSKPAPQKTGRAQPSGPVVWSETHR